MLVILATCPDTVVQQPSLQATTADASDQCREAGAVKPLDGHLLMRSKGSRMVDLSHGSVEEVLISSKLKTCKTTPVVSAIVAW